MSVVGQRPRDGVTWAVQAQLGEVGMRLQPFWVPVPHPTPGCFQNRDPGHLEVRLGGKGRRGAQEGRTVFNPARGLVAGEGGLWGEGPQLAPPCSPQGLPSLARGPRGHGLPTPSWHLA